MTYKVFGGTLSLTQSINQGVHWVHLHPQGGEKIGGGRNL